MACARLSWPFVSFWAHVNISYRIVSLCISLMCVIIECVWRYYWRLLKWWFISLCNKLISSLYTALLTVEPVIITCVLSTLFNFFYLLISSAQMRYRYTFEIRQLFRCIYSVLSSSWKFPLGAIVYRRPGGEYISAPRRISYGNKIAAGGLISSQNSPWETFRPETLFRDTGTRDLDHWPHNKWVSRSHGETFLCHVWRS